MKLPVVLALALTAAASPFEGLEKRQNQGQPIDSSGRGGPILGEPPLDLLAVLYVKGTDWLTGTR